MPMLHSNSWISIHRRHQWHHQPVMRVLHPYGNCGMSQRLLTIFSDTEYDVFLLELAANGKHWTSLPTKTLLNLQLQWTQHNGTKQQQCNISKYDQIPLYYCSVWLIIGVWFIWLFNIGIFSPGATPTLFVNEPCFLIGIWSTLPIFEYEHEQKLL